MVEEIFQKYSSNQEEMTFEEWSSWFLSLDGIKEVLELKPRRTDGHKRDMGRGGE